MADVFLNLRAVSEVENAGDLDQYGLDDADHSVYITDGEKGEKYLFIGDADPDGNYYMTIEGSENIYTIKPEALDALVFDYDSLGGPGQPGSYGFGRRSYKGRDCRRWKDRFL